MEFIILPILAFLLGYALTPAKSCTVHNVYHAVVRENYDGLLGLVFAMCWAGMVLMIYAAFYPDTPLLPIGLVPDWPLLAGGIMLGVGALINNACFMGSVARFGSGDSNYFFTLVGMGLALVTANDWAKDLIPVRSNIDFRSLSDLGFWYVFLALFIITALGSVFVIRRKRDNQLIYLALVGIFGGLLFTLHPNWSYSSLLTRLYYLPENANEWLSEIGALALFIGAAVSALRQEKFRLKNLNLSAIISCTIGGFIMGLGATLVPGGNDNLLLWSIPGLALHAGIAYIIMIAVTAAWQWRMRPKKYPASW